MDLLIVGFELKKANFQIQASEINTKNFVRKQGRKRPLDTPENDRDKRERKREREGEIREKEREEERERERDEMDREVKGIERERE